LTETTQILSVCSLFGLFGSAGSDFLNASEGSHELLSLLLGLEATVSVLGGGVNEFDVELFSLPSLDDGEEGLSDNERSLAGTADSTLDEEEIFVDFTVVRESTHGGDVLLNGISFASGVVGDVTDGTSTDSVDILVHFSSVMVTHLTTSGNCPLDSSGMPGSNTSDLAETSVRFTVKSLDTESLDDTLHTLSSGNTVDIDAFVHVEDITDSDLLLEETVA